MRGGEAWTDERVALLKQLWAQGKTADAIGDRLGGLSRSAVLGKIFRLRLGGPDTGPTSAPNRIADAKLHSGTGRASPNFDAKAASHVRSKNKNSPARRRRGVRQANANQPTAAMGRRGKTLLELTNESCRWPHGEPGTARFFFCGAPTADIERGMPYCPRHARRAFNPDALVVALAKPSVSHGASSSKRARHDTTVHSK